MVLEWYWSDTVVVLECYILEWYWSGTGVVTCMFGMLPTLKNIGYT